MFIFTVKESTIDKNGIVHVKKSCQEIQSNGRIVIVPEGKAVAAELLKVMPNEQQPTISTFVTQPRTIR